MWYSIRQFKSVEQVVAWRLCMGCGACIATCPEKNIRLVDIEDLGLRPIVDFSKCKECGECVKVCPGIEVSHQSFSSQTIPELRQAWGPVLEVWEGYATDPEIRYKGSSGGVVTALALFCQEEKRASGVLHIGVNSESPLQNIPVFSKSREDLVACTGSRYSPAAPCEKLNWFKEADSSCIFIGKPCDVIALRKAQGINPVLKDKVNFAISIFCAGTPATQGTYNLLDVLEVKPVQVKELRYRGCGWPGMTTVKLKGCNGQMRQMTYQKSWGDILSKHGQFRCRLCPDSTGEFADISCGDPWYHQPQKDELGRSLILVRTKKGREFLLGAMQKGYIKANQVGTNTLPQSQIALLNRRQNLFGRLFAMRIMRVPIPRYIGFSLFKNWRNLTTLAKLRSVVGTLRRIVSRKLTQPNKLLTHRSGLVNSYSPDFTEEEDYIERTI
jgi:coenzyme F420 hydrogenase subunit beta